MAFHQDSSIHFIYQAKKNKKTFTLGRDKNTMDFLVDRLNTLFLNINQNNLSVEVKKAIQQCDKLIGLFEKRYIKYINQSDYTKISKDLAAKCEQIKHIRDCVKTLDYMFSFKQQQTLNASLSVQNMLQITFSSNTSQLTYGSRQQKNQCFYQGQSSTLFSQPSSNASIAQIGALYPNTMTVNNSNLLNKSASERKSTMTALGNKILCGMEVYSVFYDSVNRRVILYTSGSDKMKLVERLMKKSSTHDDFSLPIVEDCWASKFILTEEFYNSLVAEENQDNAVLAMKKLT